MPKPVQIKAVYYLLVTLLICFHHPLGAQVSRGKNKSAINFRNNHQRVASGTSHTLEIRNGTLWAWGNNQYGVFGNGTNTSSSIPVRVGNEDRWTAVAVGEVHSLALKSNGTLWAWGLGGGGQMGTGPVITAIVPIQVGTDNDWVYISAGGYRSFGIRSNGTLWTWGAYALGNLDTDYSLVPIQVGSDNKWTSVHAGYYHTVALKSDGTLWSWGENGYGQLGNGTVGPIFSPNHTPSQAGTATDWVMVRAAQYHTVALKANGTLWTWGQNSDGHLGNGTAVNSAIPIQVGTENSWLSISAGNVHSHAIKSDGSLWGWGNNQSGKLGTGTTVTALTPQRIGTDDNWIAVYSSANRTMGLRSDGTLQGWGLNAGALGTGMQVNVFSPLPISSENSWAGIAPGSSHNLALRSDGSLWSWGANFNGQLGNGSVQPLLLPQRIGMENKWVSASAGDSHSLGIKSDGTLWSWGDNSQGKLGNGNTNDITVPQQVGTGNTWQMVEAGYYSSYAIKADGTLWAWGENSRGQLGTGNTSPHFTPVQVGTDNDWVSISAGQFHALGLKSNGTIWAWGYNFYGQLGTGTGEPENPTPTQVGTDRNWLTVVAGSLHSIALKSDGTIWSWGSNQSGELGNGTNTMSAVPLPAGLENRWMSIATMDVHNLGIKCDGSAWAWGNNFRGQFGNGTNTNATDPVKIADDVVFVGVGGRYSAIIHGNRGSICLAGENATGQLGDASTIQRNTFTCLPGIGPLPVTLTSVKAYQQGVTIYVEWNVQNETRVKHYEVEKSADGILFSNAGLQSATGNNMSSLTYRFADLNARAGDNLYRIKTVDLSGLVRYSPVVKVVIGKQQPGYRLYPNPASSGNINIQFINQAAGQYSISVVNAVGQTITSKQVIRSAGSSTELVKLTGGLANGKYLVVISGPGNTKQSFQVLYKGGR
ncbi:T9SS type A sorting domain-containing protein [Segetibacter sp. 3557_3]|uniref:RCC1 domain-containing protein n=1 Tax=Segetibacter sp. 3557_3 TaxID=2547429 RepID=UPI0010586D95|nr:T9SS type A sorting domain-containing protein [Segetibacter sp. 3557_3]TDH27775.1 T9SS type A sorting domain-containing protein [Segetibacter sp. 3557_3]